MTRVLKRGRLATKLVDGLHNLEHYLDGGQLPTAPPEVPAPQLNYPMAGNDQYGDCTIAGVCHLDQAVASIAKLPYSYPGDQTVISQYLTLTGGQDTGLAETDVLTYWQQAGLFGHRLLGWAPINPQHQAAIKSAVATLGAVYAGVILPDDAEDQFNNGETWHLPVGDEPDPDDGHCIIVVGYNHVGPIVVTWGQLQQATWWWWTKCAEEAYAPIAAEAASGLHGLNLAALQADLPELKAA